MKNRRLITTLVVLLCIVSSTATLTAILSTDGPRREEHVSVRGRTIELYGSGLYRDMSADVAPQGLAQDHVTLLLGIPTLLLALYRTRRGSVRARVVLAGTLAYFLVTYLFYLVMAMYNAMFLAYAAALGLSFFAFGLTYEAIPARHIASSLQTTAPSRFAGGFLIFNACAIAFLWLSIVLPPLFDGTIVPVQVEHYTTLIVQGLDLGLLLPLAIVCGLSLRRRTPFGIVSGTLYLLFLSLLMIALTAKIVAMWMIGSNIFPVIIIIPSFAVVSIVCAIRLVRAIPHDVPSE